MMTSYFPNTIVYNINPSGDRNQTMVTNTDDMSSQNAEFIT